MIDRLLQIHLNPVARDLRRRQLLHTLTIGWLAAAGAGLLFIFVHRSTGWISPWLFLVLFMVTLVWTFVTRRRSRRAPLDFQSVARTIEAENPKLHALLRTAVEQKPDAATQQLNYLQQRVIREALAEDRRGVWWQRAARNLRYAQLGNAAALVVLVVVLLALFRAAPPRVALLAMLGRGVTVTPGDVSREKGTSLVVLAKFSGPVPAAAVLVLRPANEPERRIPLTKNLDDPVFGASLSDLKSELTYRVEYDGEHTRDFKVTTFEFPRLERADAKVTFPEYTRQPEKTIEDTRRVSAVQGSVLDYTFHLNKPVASAELVEVRSRPSRQSGGTNDLDPTNPPSPVARYPLLADTNRPSVFTFNYKLEQSGRFELRLVDPAGRTNKLPSVFVLDALTNRAPELKFAFPKGDQRVSALEEITFQAEASDDFGLTSYGLAYNLAGQPPVFVELGGATGPHEKRAFGHLVPLEALGAPVDGLLSYYLWADDVGPEGNPRRTTSDMFFAEVRPFEEIFREGQPPDANSPQQPQAGQNQNAAEKLAELQKQITTATWNLQRRPRGTAATPKFRSDTQTVKESQAQALEQVRHRMEQQDDPRAKSLLQTVEREMAHAVEHLTTVAEGDSPTALPAALAAEQSAYQALLRLAAREIEVSQSQRGQSGQSNRGQRAQRQLDQLNLRQSQSRYETESQAAPAQNPQQREQLQAFNRLKELAQRQQDVNERLKELQAALQAARTAAEREEMRQRLKRLQEEQQQTLADVDELRQRMEQPENQSPMSAARQQLAQTRDEVQRAAEAMERGEVSQALSSGTRAQQDLQQLRDDFRKQSSSQFADDMRELRNQARELSQKQEDIGQKLEALGEPAPRKTLTDSDERQLTAAQLDEQQKRMAELVKHATEVTQKAEAVEPLLSRQLYDTLRKATQDDARNLQETSDDLLTQGRLRQGVEQYLRESRRGGKSAVEASAELLREGLAGEAGNLERRARRSINDLKTGVEHAAEGVLGDDTEALRFARNELDKLSRQLERELAEAQRQSNTNHSGAAQAVSGQKDESPRGADQGAPAAEQSRADAEGSGAGQSVAGPQTESPPDRQGPPSNQPGAQTQADPGGASGQGNPVPEDSTPGQATQREESTQRAFLTRQRGANNPGPGGENQSGRRADPRQRGGARDGDNFLDQFGGAEGGGYGGGPIAGTEYTQWSDRLRDVEEMLDVPELRAAAAQIRDRARNARLESKRSAVAPKWDLVKMEIAGPLVELRARIGEELARRESKEALVPIDRDPVPKRYSELVRRYYEQLGKSESGNATNAGGPK